MYLRNNSRLDIKDEQKEGNCNYKEFIITIKEYMYFTENWNKSSKINALKLGLQLF